MRYIGHAESLPASVTVVCPECGREIVTRQSGNTTRCPKRSGGCGASIPVPAGSTRPPVEVECYGCGHPWRTRAKEGSTVRCPECRHPRRVPSRSRDGLDPGRPRPAPSSTPRAASRPPAPAPSTPARGLFGSLFRPSPAPAPEPEPEPEEEGQWIDCLHCEEEWWTTAAPGNTVRCPECRKARRIPSAPVEEVEEEDPEEEDRAAQRADLLATVRAAHAEMRQTRQQRAAVPRQQTREDRQRAAKDERRRSSVCSLVTSLGGALRVRYDAAPGQCEVMDTTQPRERQHCPERATLAVWFTNAMSGAVPAYTCSSHAEPLRYLGSLHAPHIDAVIRGLR